MRCIIPPAARGIDGCGRVESPLETPIGTLPQENCKVTDERWVAGVERSEPPGLHAEESGGSLRSTPGTRDFAIVLGIAAGCLNPAARHVQIWRITPARCAGPGGYCRW